jgi:ubiquinone/menaquinone biosynthesis C-methylase UbiE
VPTLQEREKAFHDEAYASDVRAPLARFWAANRAVEERYGELLTELGSGRRVLEYGCGSGSYAFKLARSGAQVLGIDISETGIDHARSRAKEEGLEGSTEFRVMDAMDLDLPANEFDLVCGSGILHHLDLDRALREVSRVLRPDGAAVFEEPLGHNPAINLYRRLTPRMRTPDEHPLLMADLDSMGRYFRKVDSEFFSLSTLAAVPLRRRRSFPRILDGLTRFDRMLFRSVPYLRRHAWIVLIRLGDPLAS